MRRRLTAVLVLLWLPCIASAAVFTVGPGGTHSTLQAAIDAAVAAGGDNEIRVATGTWSEALALEADLGHGALHISGGWLPGFAARSSDPVLTVIDPAGAGIGFDLRLSGGTLVLEGLTVTHATRALSIYLSGAAAVRIDTARLVDNLDEGDYSRDGTGMYASLMGTSSLELDRVVVAGNLARSTNDSTSAGAGLSLNAAENSRVSVHRVLSVGNSGQAGSNQVTGAGIFLYLQDSATAEVLDSTFARNLSIGSDSASGPGGALWLNDSTQLTVARTAWLGNGSSNDLRCAQLSLIASGTSTLEISDSVVAAGTGSQTRGVSLSQRDTGTLRMTGCTVAGNPRDGVSASRENGELSIANSIVYGNGQTTSFPAGVTPLASLIDVDPLFADAGHWDYRLRAGSPAIDAGSAVPPGGLSTTDLMGLPRVMGGAVDIGAHEYRLPTSRVAVVTHASGFGGTPWRSDLAFSNFTSESAQVGLTVSQSGSRQTVSTTAAPNGSADFRDVLVSRFGLDPGTARSGSLEITSTSPAIAWTSRTFAAPGGGGTYGQALPALSPEDLLVPGELGALPLVRSDSRFYTNLGVVNGTGSPCTARVRLWGSSGSQLGSTREVTVPAWEWLQLNDVFGELGAGSASTASATVEVLTPGGAAWFYASIIDRTTKDPTTVPVQRTVAGGLSVRLPAVVHLSGLGGTPWRTAFAVSAPGGQPAHLTLVYREGGSFLVRTATVPAGGAASWDDLLVELFGLDPNASSAGSLELVADVAVATAGRAYADRGPDGTYGQALPALVVGLDGLTSVAPGVLPQIRSDGTAYTNIGFLNLGSDACDVRVTLLDGAGSPRGTPITRTVEAGAWLQANDVFALAGAGSTSTAAALVEVLTPDGRIWAYASVIDRTSRDPTTVPVAAVWAAAPGNG